MANRLIKVSVHLLLLCMIVEAGVSARTNDEQSKSKIDLITVEELKTKVAANEPLLIIDVRSSESYANSRSKIKGALHFQVRKLKYRLGFPPLKDVPKDREVITYCACPSEESAISAAQVLRENGFKRVRALKGGWTGWQKATGPVEPKR
jgi:rhodanese-related sulfurtransferase